MYKTRCGLTMTHTVLLIEIEMIKSDTKEYTVDNNVQENFLYNQ